MRLTRRTILVGVAALAAILLAGTLVLLLVGQQPAGADTARPPAAPVAAATQTAPPATGVVGAEASSGNVERQPTPSATPAPPGDTLSLTYTIDRSQVPPLYYQGLTLLVDVGLVDAVRVSATGPGGDPVPVDYRHDPERQTVAVTTAGTEVHLRLVEPQDPDNVGSYEKATLKGGAAWAWSHSLDDNVRLYPSIQALSDYGYRGTLYLIGKHIEDTREQDWIVDAPAIHRLLAEGWSIGNHTWDHACNPANIDNQTIISGYNRLAEIVAASPVPAYRVTGFAAPCFKADYHPLIQEMVAEGNTAVQFNESGNRSLLVVDPGAAEYSAGEEIAASFTYTIPIGRDPHLAVDGGLAEALATVDWMSAHANGDRHFWYNTFTHSGETEELERMAGYIYDNYGAGGTGEAWVAPADEIYSYLLVRDRTTVTFSREEATPPAP